MAEDDAKIRFSQVYVHVNENSLPSMFVQLNELRVDKEETRGHYWLQKARWVKFEENYDEVSKRFSDAHVSPLNFQDIADFQSLMQEHLIIVDCDEAITTTFEAMQKLVNSLYENGQIVDESHASFMFNLFMARRHHPEVKTQSKLDNQMFDDESKGNQVCFFKCLLDVKGFTMETAGESIAMEKVYGCRKIRFMPYRAYKSDSELFNVDLAGTFNTYAESCCVLTGKLNTLIKPMVALIRLDRPILEAGLVEVNIPVRFLFVCLGPTDNSEFGRCFAVMMKNRV
ncbi:Anion exchange protein 3 [Cichlidogyrus casuarinus]|uniref:Anion exchange protein 3 n=1 Tax=Cichlidogyrus casuarinus TaxID=1844966 RepID=A0ABD2QLF5_9PLAT